MTHTDLEAAYLDEIGGGEERSDIRDRRMISIIGPPGSGKTTLVGALQTKNHRLSSACYVEDVSDNPHIASGTLDARDTEYVDSQNWFLDQYRTFLDAHNQAATVFLDQDPSVVVLIYSKLLFEHGHLGSKDYTQLIGRGRQLERDMGTRKRFLFVLEAPPQIIADRLDRRGDDLAAAFGPIDDLVNRFHQFVSAISEIGNTVTVKLDGTDPPEKLADAVARRTNI